MTLFIDYSLCEGCGACAEVYPIFFEMRDGKAWFINYERFVMEEHRTIINVCPFRAITIE